MQITYTRRYPTLLRRYKWRREKREERKEECKGGVQGRVQSRQGTRNIGEEGREKCSVV